MIYGTYGVQDNFFSPKTKPFFMNMWMLGIFIETSRREPLLTGIETQDTCTHVHTICVFTGLFLWGTCFHALEVAHAVSHAAVRCTDNIHLMLSMLPQQSWY